MCLLYPTILPKTPTFDIILHDYDQEAMIRLYNDPHHAAELIAQLVEGGAALGYVVLLPLNPAPFRVRLGWEPSGLITGEIIRYTSQK